MIYPPKVLFIIIVLLSILILGLYSCGDESTNPTPNPNEEIKKYTLEEILADSNWVEITDTLHYPEIYEFNYLNTNNYNLRIKTQKEFEEFLRLDTMYFGNDLNIYKNTIDFSSYFLISHSTFKTSHNTIKKLFKNEKKQQLFYNIELKHKALLSGAHRFNWIQISRNYIDFNITCDTTLTLEIE